MKISLESAVNMLLERDNIAIIVHAHPDGDTLGSGYALCHALQAIGKRVRVICEDDIPKNYRFMVEDGDNADFEPEFVVAVDIATVKLMGENTGKRFGERVDLCIDHHITNSMYAENVLLDDTASAASEIIYKIIPKLGVDITSDMADALYVGVSTDTGCFRYSNVTPTTFRIAAELMELGADCARLNREIFETKSRSFAQLEKMAISSTELFYDGKFALITVTQDMFRKSGANEDEFDKISALPRQIEGVLVGAAMREQKDGTFKVSVRTNPPINAADICMTMNGGGHPAAAGCTLSGTLEENKKTLFETIGKFL